MVSFIKVIQEGLDVVMSLVATLFSDNIIIISALIIAIAIISADCGAVKSLKVGC